MATCVTAVTLPSGAGDIISVNYYNSSFSITGNQTGTVGGVGAAGWTNVHHESGTETIVTEGLKNQLGENTSAKLTTQLNTGMWGNNQADTSTVEGALLRAYIDLNNYASSGNHYYIDFAADYAISTLTLYFSGDGNLFAPVEINGTRYIGVDQVATAIAADDTTTWGNRTTGGSKTISANNAFALSNVVGSAYHVTNVDLSSNNRATLSGFQVQDLTDSVAWNATLNPGATNIGDVAWEKASSAAEGISDAVLTITTSDNGSSLALGDGTTYHVIQGTSGELTLTGSNLSIDGLHAKQGAKITLDGTLASTAKPNVSGYGTVALTNQVSAASAKAILQNSNGIGTLELNQKVTIAVGEKTTFGGTLVINNADTAAYGDGTNTDATGYDLVLGNNTYNNSADISSVSQLVLNNAGVYYAGNGATIHNLTLSENSDSRLKVEHMGGGVLTFAGETSLAQGSHMTAVSRWTSNVTFDHLTGNGTLTLQGAPTNSADVTTYVVNSLQGFSGTLDLAKGNGQNKEIITINTGTGSDVTLSGFTMSGTTGKGYSVTLSGSQVLSISGTATLSAGTLEIAEGAKLEINKAGGTEAQLNINGGNLQSLGTLCIGRRGSGGGRLSMTSGSIKAKEILSAWGGSINLSGGSLEFTGGDELSAIRKGSAQGGTPDNSADVTFNGVTLKAADTAWKVDGDALSSLSIGNLTISNDTQNVITLAHAKTLNQTRTITNNSTGDGKLVLDALQFNNRLNISGTGVTEFTGGSTLSGSFSAGAYSLVADTDVTLKGSADSYAWGNSKIAVNRQKTLTIASGAKLTVGDIRYTDTAGGQHGTIRVEEGGSVSSNGILRLEGITNDGTVTLTTANEKTVGSYAQGSTGVLNLAEGVSMTTSKADGGTIAGSYALGSGATLNIKQLGADVTAALKDLTLATKATMGVYTDNTTDEASEAGISVSGTLSAGSGAKLNAHLSLGNDTTLNIADATVGGAGLTMGSSVTFEQGGKMNLSDDIINGLNGLITSQAFKSGLTLFSGVDSFNINGAAYDADATYKASDYFNLNNDNVAVTRPWDFVVKFGDGTAQNAQTIFLWMETPEPATATLSLLALAALAARRKRK